MALMNTARANNRLMNNLITPLSINNSNVSGATPPTNSKNWMPSMPEMPSMPSMEGIPYLGIIIFLILVGVFIAIMILFRDQLESAWKSANDVIKGYFGSSGSVGAASKTSTPSSNTPVTEPAPQGGEAGNAASSVVEKVLPGGGNQVFNVSSNRFTYYDAEPLCKALGAELATYDQVKEAWKSGADWCNYGWVKGQMAVYPTSDETYEKAQNGPEGQRMSCGVPGINGGYFDNPEMRFGVTCYGKKPPQSKHDEANATKGAPLSPDALEFDKKVNYFKSQSDSIGILPFNTGKWST